MRIDKIDVMPVLDSINPEILFEIYLFIERNFEIPIEITGSIFSDENKKIANIHNLMYASNQGFELAAEYRENKQEENRTVKLIAPLSHKVLDYIETLREKNKKGDVVLTLDIVIRTLTSKTIISPIIIIRPGGEIGTNIERGGNYLIAHNSSGNFSPSNPNMWILSGNGSPTFIKTIDYNSKNKVIIRSSDWIHDYCPVFQIGRFSVFEYLLPDYAEGSGSIEEKLNASIDAIKKMEENLIRGDWNGVIEDSRAVWELFKKDDEIKDLLKRDGYTEEAINELCGYTDKSGCKHSGCIGNLFNLTSKFHHKLDMNKKLQPDIKASKEDAYLIYATSMTFVNLISKKMQRLNPINP
ncbi:MAG: hypothetical protein WC556_04065 [Candidatus Methanoperedens sp.]